MSLSTRANFSAGVGYGNQQGGRSGRHHTSPLIPEPTPNLNVRFATKATGGQFIVASSSYSMSMVVRPLLTFKHPRGSYLYLCSHSITSLVVKYLG